MPRHPSNPMAAATGTPASVPGLPGSGPSGDVNELLKAVQSGQVSAEQLMAFLALLTGGQGQGPSAGAQGARQANARRQAQRLRGRSGRPARGRGGGGGQSPIASALRGA